MPQMDFFRRPLLVGKNIRRLTNGTIRGSVRRNDPDSVSASPYFPNVSATQTLIVQTEAGTYTATLTNNTLSQILTDVQTALGSNATAFDSDGTLGLRTTGVGGAGFIQVTGGTAATALGFDTTVGRSLRSSGGDVASAPEARLGNPFGVAFPGFGEDFSYDVFGRALYRLAANIDVLYSDVLREYAEVQKVTGWTLDATNGNYITLPATVRAFNGYVSAGSVLTRLSTAQDLAPYFVVLDSTTQQPTPYKVVGLSIGNPPGNPPVLPLADAASASDTGKNALGLNLSKFGPTSITSIREGRVVTCTGAGTALLPGDVVSIASATNTARWSNNGMKWVVEQIIDANNITLRPLAQSALNQLGVTLNDTQPVLELADDLSSGQSYGTLQGFTASFVSGVSLILSPPAPVGGTYEVWVAQPMSQRSLQSNVKQRSMYPFAQSQSPFKAGSISQTPLAAQRFSAGATADILQIRNESGVAIGKFGANAALTLTPDGTNTTAITATGTGSGVGLQGTGGGASGLGVYGVGGGPNGVGVVGQGTGNGQGVSGNGGTSGGPGITGTGGSGGHGIVGQGTTTGKGGVFTGGATAGAVGVTGTGGSGGGDGVQGTGTVNGNGGTFTGAGTGIGVQGTGGATGPGGSFTGGASGAKGVVGVGTVNNVGGDFTGNGTGAGVQGTGGGTNASGVRGVGGATNGVGVTGIGTGSGAGVSGTGGATGVGVLGTGGATSGVGGSFTGGPNSNGITSLGTGTGVGLAATGGNTSGGHGVTGTAGTGGGYGGLFTAAVGFAGVRAVGQGAGEGIQGIGGSTAPGVTGTGGTTSGVGGAFTGGPNSAGATGAGTGTGVGLQGTGGATGAPGVVAIAGSGNTRGALSLGQQALPTAPANGDIWYDGTNISAQLASATQILATKTYVDTTAVANLIAAIHTWTATQTFNAGISVTGSSGGTGGVFNGGVSNGTGISATGNGTGSGAVLTGGSNAPGLIVQGNGTSGPAIQLVANSQRPVMNFPNQGTPATRQAGDLWWDAGRNSGAGGFMYRGTDGVDYQITHV